MKKKILLILILTSFLTFSQTLEVKYYENPISEVKTNISTNKNDKILNHFSYTLIHSNHQSFYTNDSIKPLKEDEDFLSYKSVNQNGDSIILEGKIIRADDSHKKMKYYKNFENNNLSCTISDGIKKFNIVDKLFDWNWKITDDTEKIIGYTCKKATSNYMGANFTAWFTEEIPINTGPEKFDGLPGIILKVITPGNEIIAYSINENENTTEIEPPKFEGKTFTFLEALNYNEDKSNYKTINSGNFKPGDKIIIKTD